MSDLQDPPIPSDTDVRDLDGFMLNVERLMASELVALSSHEVIAAALFLWCRAWKQLPAASLPDDDRVIAAFAKLPLAKFKKLRDQVMRGFVKCSDGRWYHTVLAAEAFSAFGRKKSFQKKREGDAERLRNWRKSKHETPKETHSETRFVAEGQGQGQGQVNQDTPSTTEPSEGSDGSPPPSRTLQIIQLLTRLEAARGKTLAPVVTSDKVLAAWVEAGVSDAQIEEAHGLAAAKRQKDDDAAPVNIGLMDVFVAKVVNPKEGASAVTGAKREWHDSNAAVQAKGDELGLKWVDYLSSGRLWPIYKRDVLAKCGIDWSPETGARKAA